jgi:hypothetical protein
LKTLSLETTISDLTGFFYCFVTSFEGFGLQARKCFIRRLGALKKRATGFEPATSSLGSWHSTTELRPQIFPYLMRRLLLYKLRLQCAFISSVLPNPHMVRTLTHLQTDVENSQVVSGTIIASSIGETCSWRSR